MDCSEFGGLAVYPVQNSSTKYAMVVNEKRKIRAYLGQLTVVLHNAVHRLEKTLCWQLNSRKRTSYRSTIGATCTPGRVTQALWATCGQQTFFGNFFAH